MKPCSNKRQDLALLAAQSLESSEEKDIRAHLENCPNCREYFETISGIAKQISVVAGREPAIQSSERFHQNLVRMIKQEESAPVWHRIFAAFRSQTAWRMAVPAAIAVALAAVLISERRTPTVAPVPTLVKNSQNPSLPEPTVSNYQWAANRSLETLDDLLTRQANRNPSSVQTYTAASLYQAAGTE